MAIEFNIREQVLSTFDYVGLPFPAFSFQEVDLPNLGRLGRALLNKDILGRPFFDTLKIGDYEFPNEPLLTISNRNIIQETIVVGSERKGTVKEFITADDYSIKVEGVLLGRKEYPAIDADGLVRLCESRVSLPVENDILNLLFGVQEVVINSYGFPPMKGQPYSQAYYILLSSNEDFFGELVNGPGAAELIGL
ncbi:MAG: DUF6046 domain-containing protein [Bacteroidota bacterium]